MTAPIARSVPPGEGDAARRTSAAPDAAHAREAAMEMDAEQFRALGHTLVDELASFLAGWRERRLTPGETPKQVRDALGRGGLPAHGADAGALLARATTLMRDHSLFNGHPRFFGYITSSAAPLGALADLLASTMNPNVGAWELSPMASEIEAQSLRWIAELIGYPMGDGILVSGGNMANFIGFLAGRRALLGEDARRHGLGSAKLAIYASAETHTWIHKAADLFGFGTDVVRFVPPLDDLTFDVGALRQAIARDRDAGVRPFMLIGTAGTVSTGAVDPLDALAEVAREHGMWFHVDGAYGAIAAALPESPARLRALALADSVAVDPHKWLYSPIEAGATFVRQSCALTDAFAWHPPYYAFGTSEDEPPFHYHERGMQNSRGFRALKVWLTLQQAGREGVERMVRDDIALAQAMHAAAAAHPEFETGPAGLSIATFRYAPRALREAPDAEARLNALNEALLAKLKLQGELFLTNAVIRGRFLLRACIVNFRTTRADVEAVPALVAEVGRAVAAELAASR